MREHLYRAWLIKDKKMVDVKSIHFGTKKIMYGYSHGKQSYGNTTCSFDDCKLMEFTGLTDKNGKKIFEGDILDDRKENGCVGVIVFEDGAFKVRWYGTTIMLYPYGYDDAGFGELETDHLDMYVIEKFEVIGNIHDNPELLEVKK